MKQLNFKSKLIFSIALKTGFPSVLGVISYYNRAFKRTMIISIFKFIDCIIFASKIVKYYTVFNSTGHRCTNLAHKISKKSLVSVTRWWKLAKVWEKSWPTKATKIALYGYTQWLGKDKRFWKLWWFLCNTIKMTFRPTKYFLFIQIYYHLFIFCLYKYTIIHLFIFLQPSFIFWLKNLLILARLCKFMQC